MIDSKTRALLRSKSSLLAPIVNIGQGGITENLIAQIDGALDTRELIKVAVLPNSEVVAKKVVNELANILGAEPVSAIGNKFVLYRYSKKVKNHIIDKPGSKSTNK